MSLAGLPEWVSELISKGESVSACLSLYKEMQATEREERAFNLLIFYTIFFTKSGESFQCFTR
jgi:hypothetical protein